VHKSFLVLFVVMVMTFGGLLGKSWSDMEFCKGLELKVDIFRLNKDGGVLNRLEESYRVKVESSDSYLAPIVKKCELSGYISPKLEEGEPPLSVRFFLNTLEGHKLKLSIIQYPASGFQPMKTSIEQSQVVMLNSVESVVYKSAYHKQPEMIVRFTPEFKYIQTARDIKGLPLSALGCKVIDGGLHIQVRDLNFKGTYLYIKTHKMSLALSYRPFAGASRLGEARGKFLKLELAGEKITFESYSDFLPPGVVGNVYGVFSEKRTSDLLFSEHKVFEDEASFLDFLEKNLERKNPKFLSLVE
jgi:hypothetical protein